jgi:two-component system NtrC family response regulator
VAAGACDVLQPPIAAQTLRCLLAQAVRLARLVPLPHGRHTTRPAQELLPGIIGESPAMAALRQQVLRVAPTDASIVLTGESGTGKEVIARALHAASRRASRAFVAINCAAIPETLLESELFGYERGAFTGALKQTPGRIELAHRGTLFLDEIGDLPMALQAKLLRFLQERVIERLGGRIEIPLDVRIVCATHRGLAELSAAGRFREDLYYRLAEIALHLSPLRERDGDAILLAQHYLRQYAATASMPVLGFTGSALEAIDRHRWPGNVRELQNRVKRAVILAEHPRIMPADLDLGTESAERDELDLRRARDRVERSIIDRALARCEGNLTATARLIGVSRPTLYDLLRHHGLRS